MADVNSGAPAQDTTEAGGTETGKAQATPETKPAETPHPNPEQQTAATSAASGTDAAAGEQAKDEGAQAKTDAEIELKFPDGVALDTKLMDGFKATAKEIGLDSPKAQQLADLYLEHQQALAKAHEEEARAVVAQWRAEVDQDKEFGGAALQENLALAAKAIDRFGGEELRQVLEQSGFGDHPAFVRAFIRIGKQLREDSIAGTSAAPASQLSPEERLRRRYPNTPNPR